MELEVLYIKEPENIDLERIVIKVNQECNIGSFYLTKAQRIDDDHISNNTTHGFWLPDIDVKSGDKIIIYTKDGVMKRKQNSYFKSIFLYMKRKSPLWTENSCAVLMKINDFQCKTTD